MRGFPNKPMAFVDIETTGGSPEKGGIIEIAIITVENGQVVDRWTSLVNPERPLPYFITSITGIVPEELEEAPTFASLASEVYQRLNGKIFVAHNARFDYSFIKNELKRNDLAFRSPTLCTVKLSRTLFPRYKKHNLDVLIERFNLNCENRHRALDDAQAMIDFIEVAQHKLGMEKVVEVVAELLKSSTLPSLLSQKLIDDLPDETGVYIFKEKSGRPIYIGKSINIRRRVLSHFSGDHHTHKELKIKEAIEDIDFHVTPGELGALLLESTLIKTHLPIYNKKLRRLSSQTVVCTKEDSEGYLTIEFKRGDELEAGDLPKAYGVFTSTRAAKMRLELLIQEDKLCSVRLGLEKGALGKTCFDYHLGKCTGGCVGEMKAVIHNFKLLKALSSLKHQAWPFNGPIGIEEKGFSKTNIHVIHEWTYLGSAQSTDELHDLLDSSQKPDFEFDTYKILRSYLRKSSKKIKIISLEQSKIASSF